MSSFVAQLIESSKSAAILAPKVEIKRQIIPLKKGSAFFLSLSVIGSLPAATYFADSVHGNDSNSGLSPSSAWQTIGHVNQTSFLPGDSILLQRGCIWQGTGFKATGNGSVQSPITLADYGDPRLPLPIIDGVGPHE